MKPIFLLSFPLLALLLPGLSTAAPVDQPFSYDTLGRLTNAARTSYTDDPAGNITQTTSPVSASLFATPGKARRVLTSGPTADDNAPVLRDCCNA